MQEHEIFMAKLKSAGLSANPGLEHRQENVPVKTGGWFSWVRRLAVLALQTQDLDFEKYKQLEAKRTRHQIERSRTSGNL